MTRIKEAAIRKEGKAQIEATFQRPLRELHVCSAQERVELSFSDSEVENTCAEELFKSFYVV